MTFNEKDFIQFLKGNSNELFTINHSKRSYENKSYSAIRANEDYSILFEMNPTDLNDLTRIYKQHNGYNFEAFYFNKINTLIFENSYYKEKIENNLEEIKVHSFDEIYSKLFNELNKEFQNRESYLREAFKNEKEKIEEMKERNKEHAFKLLIGKDSNNYEFISDYKFKEIRNRQMAYEYLVNPTEFIQMFINGYLKDIGNLESIKLTICRQLAIDELINEMKNNPYVDKAKFVYELLENELNGAKKIWIKTIEGKEIQVENRVYDCRLNDFSIGSYGEEVQLDKIAGFKYSRKFYEIPAN